MESIFIQIASYRDVELKKTLKDCLAKAKNPENLVFSIAWQHSAEDTLDDISEYKGNPQFKILDIDYKDTSGVCWARNLLQQQYDGEMYTLQLDSHHRFVKGWDEYLINTHKDLISKGYKNPLITSYIPGYDPITDTYINPNEVWALQFNRFAPEGVLHLNPWTIPNPENLTMPIHGRLYSAHFAFAAGSFVKEVPHDPYMYFHGEEPSIGIRAFTHGYDIFHPHKCFVYHFYERKGFKRHWDDNGARYDFLKSRSDDRFRKLLGVKCEREDLGEFGLGTERSLEVYERYAGIRFKDCKIQQYTLRGYEPPNPYYALAADYEKSFLNFYRHCIDIRYDQVPEKDYEFWVVAFHDKDGRDVARQDLSRSEIDVMFKDPDGYCKIWREFFYDREPVKWIVWPFSTSKGYMPWIEGRVDLIKPLGEKKVEVLSSPEPIREKGPKQDMRALYLENLKTPYEKTKAIATIDDVDEKITLDTFSETILVHLPAYREPELIPTILDALNHATNPARIHFGICRQYNPEDGFDNLDEFRSDPRFKILDIPYEEAKGLPWARAQINETLLTDEDYVLQLDSHHRFVNDWDSILIGMHNGLEKDGVEKPIVTGYTPMYSPYNDPGGRVMEPWMSGFRCFYALGTIFIGPQLLHGWEDMVKPQRARFLCGHFDFARSQWAKDVRHDPTILFAGEEINLTVRSWTHGYDFYHPHRLVLWHGTMREERDSICKWDDDGRKGVYWEERQNGNRRMIMKLFGIEDHPEITLDPAYGLGTERTVPEYERFAGLDFKNRRVQKYTEENQYPPNPLPIDYESSFLPSFYYVVNIEKKDFPRDDYKDILVAFDDEKGEGVNLEWVAPNFNHGVIHYAKYFTSTRPIHRVVYWGHLHNNEYIDRVEHIIEQPKPQVSDKEPEYLEFSMVEKIETTEPETEQILTEPEVCLPCQKQQK